MLKIASVITRSNYEYLKSEAGQHEHLAVIGEAFLLVLVSGISGAVWTAFWSQFLPLYVAVPCGLFAGAFIFLIDQSIGAAEWALSGVLQKPGLRHTRNHWLRIGMRFAMTFIFSFATSTGAEMWMFQKAIDQKEARVVVEQNQRTTAYYLDLEDKARQQILSVQYGEMQRQTNVFNGIISACDGAERRLAAAQNRLSAAKIEAQRELNGEPGYKHGAGPRYHIALDDQRTANADIAKATADIGICKPRVAEVKQDMDKAAASLRDAEPAIKPAIAALEAEKERSLVTVSNDPLLSYMALLEVMKDPHTGPAATFFGWLMMAVLMTIEVSYVVVRTWFTPASLHNVMLIKTTRLAAARHGADFERQMDEMSGPSGRAPLRIIDLDPD